MNTILDMGTLGIEEGCVPQCSPRRSVDSGTPSSKASTSNSEGQPDLSGNNHWNGFVSFLKKGSQMPFQTLQPLKNVSILRRKSSRVREDLIPSLNSPSMKSSFDAEFYRFKSSWKNFTLPELQSATNYFSHGMQSFS